MSRSIADDIVAGLRSVTKKWATQRKREERHASVRYGRIEYMRRERKESQRDVAFEVMEKAYLKASAGGTPPPTATQIMYAARPEIQERTGKKLNRQYFNATLLPDYLEEFNPDWAEKVTFDDCGHFTEPHTERSFGLGTVAVRGYLSAIAKALFHECDVSSAAVGTHGPDARFGAVLFVEKEGFLPLLETVHLAERYDVAIMSTKGMSVTAARQLADEMCGRYKIPMLVLHDFDKSGFSILGTLRRDTKRYTFRNKVEVIDLGLRLADIAGLQDEQHSDTGSESTRAYNLRENGATEAEIKFLLKRRVELNAMTSDQLVAFIERKLKKHGIKKVVPGKERLDEAFRLFTRGHRIEQIVEEELQNEDDEDEIEVPADLERRVRKRLKDDPKTSWDDAVSAIASELEDRE